jgi:DNA-binding XRE family transcriptional regulator
MKAKEFDEILDEQIGLPGSEKRTNYENELNAVLFGLSVQESRKSKGMSQSELGELLGVQRSHISKIENGTYNLTLQTMRRLATALGLSIRFELTPQK